MAAAKEPGMPCALCANSLGEGGVPYAAERRVHETCLSARAIPMAFLMIEKVMQRVGCSQLDIDTLRLLARHVETPTEAAHLVAAALPLYEMLPAVLLQYEVLLSVPVPEHALQRILEPLCARVEAQEGVRVTLKPRGCGSLRLWGRS